MLLYSNESYIYKVELQFVEGLLGHYYPLSPLPPPLVTNDYLVYVTSHLDLR